MALLNDAFDGLSLFYENSTTVIYKGERKTDRVPVILKSHKNPDEMYRIKHEYDLLFGKKIAGATHVLDISYNDDKNYLVLEDNGALVLDDYIADGQLELGTLLKIAKSAADALGHIHTAGIVHCDVKPANMLIHPDTLEVSFIDFGISLAQHQREAQSSEGFAGTLEFMAPEQTGRLNMKVDARSDLYSLGITLYYMLTGRLPFTGETAVEIIHAQTVLPPAPVSQFVTVDPMVEALVMKLMEKSPRKRFQSAESLAYDLERCVEGLQAGTVIEPFALGEKDVFASLEPGQRLFGKQKALEDLGSVFFETPKDKAALVQLHGPEGAGKSSLLETFEQFVDANNGYLLRGGFDWKDNAESYSAIREMFSGFELFAYNVNLPLPEYRTRLLEALGDNAGVLVDIVPAFGPILGEQPAVKKLSPLETQERARLVFRTALGILCDAPYPFVLVFDNVQWADPNSLDIILHAAEGKDVGNCIIVLAYQDSDPAFVGNLASRVGALDKASLVIKDVALKFLSLEDVTALVCDLFDQDSMEASELAEILLDATGGELTKIRLMLQLMYRNRQIQYDGDSDTWTIHLENLDGDILKDLENRYKDAFDKLDTEKQALLARLSCLGEHINAEDAAVAFDVDKAELDAELAELVSGKWITHSKIDEGVYSFSNKAIYDLCYNSTPEAERNVLHKQVVDRLYAIYKDNSAEMLRHSTLFTRQVNFSCREQFDEATLHDISRYKLTAAEEFMAAANMAQAAKTFENGLKLLGSTPFETDYDLAYELHLQYALCCFALRQEEKATSLLELALENAKGEDDCYKAYHAVVQQYLTVAEWDKAQQYAERYLAQAGLLLPEGSDFAALAAREYKKYVDGCGDEGILVFMGYQFTQDKLVEHHGNMLTMLSEALLFNLDERCGYYLYTTINLGLQNKALFSEFIRLFCVAAGRYAGLRHFEKAKSVVETGIEYAEKYGTGQALLWCIYGNMITHWVNPMSEITEIYKRAKYHALMEGNAFYEAYADMMLLNYHSFIGEKLEDYHLEAQATLHNLERTGMMALRANFTTFRQYARCLLGRTADSDSFEDAQFSEESLRELEGTWHGLFNEPFYYVYMLRACYIHLHFDKALEYAKKMEAYLEKYNMSAYLIYVQFRYYYSMTLLELARLHPEKKDEYLAVVRENQKDQKRIAELNPTNFEFKNMLVETGMKSLDSTEIGLVDEFSMEHRGFMAKGLIWDAVFVERLIGNFWMRRNIPQYMEIHRKNRLELYREIGAKVCIRLLNETDEDSLLRRRARRARPSYTMRTVANRGSRMSSTFMSGVGSRSKGTGLNASLDFEAMLEVLDRLIELDTMPALAGEFMSLMLQNGNAEKAMLFLVDGPVVKLKAAKYAVESQSAFNQTELPLEITAIEDDIIPKKLVEMALDKNEVLCANTSRSEYRMIGDAYINAAPPESLLCLPVATKEKQLGVVYLENASLPGAFPEGRIHFLMALVNQTSALIQNLQNVAKMADYTKDLEKRLSSYLAQQNALIAGIAHEINSPVGVCLTVSTKIHERTQKVIEAFTAQKLGKAALVKYLEETRDGLNIINNNVMRAGNLVQNFKKMSVEQSTEVFETLDLGPTLRNIVEYIRPGVKKKIDAISVEVPDDLWVYTSSGTLAQIFTNMIMNSSIHGFEDMEKADCHAEIVVTDYPQSDEIEIRYSDNGKGMTAEEKDKVFQPFYTTKRNRGGSGLGGHIILTNVTQTLRGSIQCESAPGEGTTYIMRLPKSKPQAPAKEG